MTSFILRTKAADSILRTSRGPGELDRWSAAANAQQLALVRQVLRLLDAGEYQMVQRTLVLQRHWCGVSERIQQLREEMQRS